MASNTRLLVKEAFPGYVPGARITDAAEMKRVTASHPDHVLREPAPAPAEAAPPPRAAAQAATLPLPKTGTPAPAAAPATLVTDHKLND